MSRYNVTKQMDEYVSDFGKTYVNLGIKIQAEAPLIDSLYQTRALAACGGNKFFSPRYIQATFADGRKLKYPVANESDVKFVANQLIGAGAVCLDYYGEEWNLVTGAAVGGDLNYKPAPYTNLVSSKTFARIAIKERPIISTIYLGDWLIRIFSAPTYFKFLDIDENEFW